MLPCVFSCWLPFVEATVCLKNKTKQNKNLALNPAVNGFPHVNKVISIFKHLKMS